MLLKISYLSFCWWLSANGVERSLLEHCSGPSSTSILKPNSSNSTESSSWHRDESFSSSVLSSFQKKQSSETNFRHFSSSLNKPIHFKLNSIIYLFCILKCHLCRPWLHFLLNLCLKIWTLLNYLIK